MDYGITKDGFRRKTYEVLLEEHQERLRDAIDQNLNLSNDTTFGRYSRSMAWMLSELWEVAENTYYSPFVNTAEGEQLDNVAMNQGFTRNPATQAFGEVTIYGETGTEIPKGFLVSDEAIELIYMTSKGGYLEDGKITLPIESTDVGANFNVGAGVVNTMVNPIPDIDSLKNEKDIESGKDVEEDFALRERIDQGHGTKGSATRIAIQAALLGMPDVTDAFVRENIEMVEVDGLPPKSVAPVVKGADDEEIARTILKAKAGGIRSYGTTEIDVEDSGGVEQTVGFTRPEEVKVYVEIELQPIDGYKGKEAVQDAVINYIGGVNNQGKKAKGLKLGEDVSLARVIGQVMSVGGIADAVVKLGTSEGNLKAANIEVADLAMAETSLDRVVINHAR